MGKKQHQKDKLYLTTSEWKHLYGGYKDNAEARTAKADFRRLPFDHCCLSLQPFEDPMCDLDGNIFDLVAIVPYLKAHGGRNPVTGAKLDSKSLTRLKMYKNSDGAYHCPVTYQVFSNNTYIAAIRPTGNVFAYDAIEQLNIKAKYWRDLLTDDPFTRSDIVTIQDPSNLRKFNIAAFYHVKQGIKARAEASSKPSEGATLRFANTETRATLKQLKEGYEVPSYLSKPGGSAAIESGRGRDAVSAAHYSTGVVAAGLTSTTMNPETTHTAALIEEEALIYERIKKKAYIRLMTNVGPLNMELYADQVPRTCENFLKLCARGYYNGVLFHRLIKHFIIQGGDPSGTGKGGESIWGKSFRDEFKSNLTHSGRGIVSMANSGKDSNSSQFFITFRSCNHLDNKHTVFGKVVGGLETLSAMEKVETDDDDRPLEVISITGAQLFVDPYAEAEEQLGKDRETVKEKGDQKAREEAELRLRCAAVSRKRAGDLQSEASISRSGIGKYIKKSKEEDGSTLTPEASSSNVAVPSDVDSAVIEVTLKATAPKKLGDNAPRPMSDFSSW